MLDNGGEKDVARKEWRLSLEMADERDDSDKLDKLDKLDRLEKRVSRPWW